MSLRNLLAGVLVLLALLWSVRRLGYHLSSPEQQVRGQLESMVASFNETVSAGVLGGFAEQYRDEGTGTDRDGIREILVYLFLREFRSEGSSLRCELLEEELEIEIDPAGRASAASAASPAGAVATVRLRALFHQRRGAEERLYWDARGVLVLEDQGSEWEIVRSRDFNHADRSGR